MVRLDDVQLSKSASAGDLVSALFYRHLPFKTQSTSRKYVVHCVYGIYCLSIKYAKGLRLYMGFITAIL